MPKRKISAKEFAADIRNGLNATALAAKYEITDGQLHVAVEKLVAAGVVTMQEVERFKQPGKVFSRPSGRQRCPACTKVIDKSALECPHCGVIIAKWQGRMIPTGSSPSDQIKKNDWGGLHGDAFLDMAAEADPPASAGSDYPPGYKEYLAKSYAEQIRAFVTAVPERRINPYIQKQLDWIKESDFTRAADLTPLSERLERVHALLGGERNWENLSQTQVSRLWHHDGILLAEQNNVAVMQVVGPLDKRTCPVCQHMVGLEIDVKMAANHVRIAADIRDPGAYLEAFPFPRLEDVDNIGRDELAAKGPLTIPPYHPGCRHELIWLFLH